MVSPDKIALQAAEGMLPKAPCLARLRNLLPIAHVSFVQRRDTELWNNLFLESMILGRPVLRGMRTMV